jgi:superoxide dismutase, Cu-Zn family
MRNLIAVVVTAALFLLTGTVAAQASANKVKLINSDRQEVGEATVVETPNGVLIALNLNANPPGIAPGTHAIHIHEVGQCEPPFKSAGAHFNPTGKKHGFLDKQGDHAGDLPNIHVPKNAPLSVEFLITEVSLASGKANLSDADGFAIVIHEKADDYKTDPAGDSGDRIACGPFVRSNQAK